VIFAILLCSLVCVCFPCLKCRVATLLNPFTGSLFWKTCLHCFLPSPGHWSLTVLVYPDSCEGKCFVITFVVEGVGYRAVEGVCAGMAVLNPEYQDAHNQENWSYICTSCGFGLTDRSEIRKVQGYRYLCALGRGSTSLLHPWLASKA